MDEVGSAAGGRRSSSASRSSPRRRWCAGSRSTGRCWSSPAWLRGGCGVAVPAALSIITTTFHGADRNRALGAWAAIGGTGSAVGVLLGGALTSGPATVGMVLAAGGFGWLAQLSGSENALGEVLPGFMISAAGLVRMFIVATTSAVNDVDHREAGLMSGLVNTNHELGASLGIAFVAAITGASVDSGDHAVASVAGFQNAFPACAIVAVVVVVMSPLLLPAGKPNSDGPVFAH